MDFAGPFSTSHGFRYILVVIDVFSLWLFCVPLREISGPTVAYCLVSQVFCSQGIPKQVFSDNGPPFSSHLMKDVCKVLNIDQKFAPEYDPAPNGQVERMMAPIVSMIAIFANARHDNWSENLPLLVFAYNSSPHAMTGKPM